MKNIGLFYSPKKKWFGLFHHIPSLYVHSPLSSNKIKAPDAVKPGAATGQRKAPPRVVQQVGATKKSGGGASAASAAAKKRPTGGATTPMRYTIAAVPDAASSLQQLPPLSPSLLEAVLDGPLAQEDDFGDQAFIMDCFVKKVQKEFGGGGGTREMA